MTTKLTCTKSNLTAVFNPGCDYDFSHAMQMVRSNGGYSYQVERRGDVIVHDSTYGHFEFVEAE